MGSCPILQHPYSIPAVWTLASLIMLKDPVFTAAVEMGPVPRSLAAEGGIHHIAATMAADGNRLTRKAWVGLGHVEEGERPSRQVFWNTGSAKRRSSTVGDSRHQ